MAPGVGDGAGGDLVQIFGDVQAISVHSHVAHAPCVIRGELTLDREIPLLSLGVAIVGIYSLIEATASIRIPTEEGAVLGNWMSGAAFVRVGINVEIRGSDTAVVEGERT